MLQVPWGCWDAPLLLTRAWLNFAVVPITRKPGEVVTKPSQADGDEDFSACSMCTLLRDHVTSCPASPLTSATCSLAEELQATMTAALRLPQQKSKFPLTASQEVGCVAAAACMPCDRAWGTGAHACGTAQVVLG